MSYPPRKTSRYVMRKGRDVDAWTAREAWERQDLIREAMWDTLDALTEPTATKILAAEIAQGLGAPDEEVNRFLQGVAPVMDQAQRDHGRAFPNQHGTVSIPWVWHPAHASTNPHAEAFQGPEEAVKSSSLPDYEEWVRKNALHFTPDDARTAYTRLYGTDPQAARIDLEEAGRLADCKTCGGTFLAVDIVNGKCTDCEDWSVAKED